MCKFERAEIKNNDKIAQEWDEISPLRYEQLTSNRDLSYNYILKPFILEKVKYLDNTKIIEIGCGTGNLASELINYGSFLLGIDLSRESIKIAQETNKDSSKMIFQQINIEEYASSTPEEFSLAISNMVLMDVQNLNSVVDSIYKILKPNGKFIFTIIHPCFWAQYKQYNNEHWFKYEEEFNIIGNFTITLDPDNRFKTSHTHRPLEQYINTLIQNSFILEEIKELSPQNNHSHLFNNTFKYPRFLGITVSKN
ncbi:hypothetical protein COJ07_21475 [Bacillus cereus]|uniref:class I SAM-dependent DNA methyltransferase n=1 Tax=Bacillus cereus TaxID=1396 RepID=UPI000BF65528|nr:class I SAM-dependent methyltransferase [Bacillus cereus]PFL17643.1 hypothetical protein COJ07_21475 [Bacillus cereus]